MSPVRGHKSCPSALHPWSRALRRERDGRLERQVNSSSSAFESEIVTCRSVRRREVRLLCKYEVPAVEPAGPQPRGVIARGSYERRCTVASWSPSATPPPRFYGAHATDSTGLAACCGVCRGGEPSRGRRPLPERRGGSDPVPPRRRIQIRGRLHVGNRAEFLTRYAPRYLADGPAARRSSRNPSASHRAGCACACQRSPR